MGNGKRWFNMALSSLARAAKALAMKGRTETLDPEEVFGNIDVGAIKERLLREHRKATPQPKEVEAVNVPMKAPFLDTFVDRLGKFEGTSEHKSVEGGAPTGAFGVKDSRGLSKGGEESNRDFAKRVVDVHRKDIVDDVGLDAWDTLPEGVKTAVLDLKYNTGSVGSGLRKAIKEGGGEEEVMVETLDTVRATILENQGEFTKGDKIVSPGLARRRASAWNEAFPDKKITEVSLEQSGDKATVTYLSGKDKVLEYSTKAYVSKDFKNKTGPTSFEL